MDQQGQNGLLSTYREGSYFIVVFDAPSDAIDEVERGLNITEEVMRHLVTRIERPARRADKKDEEAEEGAEAEESGGGEGGHQEKNLALLKKIYLLKQ